MATEGIRNMMIEASLSSPLALVESGRDPLPPFTHHVYIGHSFKDTPSVQSLCKKLETTHHVKCYPRHIRSDSTGDDSIKQRIDEGVWASEKCVLLMTREYEGDVFSNYEMQTVHDKAKRFSNVLIIVVWLNTTRRDEFNNYKYFVEQVDLVSYCNDLDKLATLAKLITKRPKASLLCLPKDNIGYGAATGFFYGFLRLVLPGFRERCHKAVRDFDKAGGNMIDRTIGKMLIILPKSCFATQTLTVKDKIEVVKDLNVTRWANRAGNVLRDYKSTMYKLTDQCTREVFYFAGELATPLLTLYETYCFGLLGMTLDQLYRERDAFCYTLHQVLQHGHNRECNDQFRLIMWDDSKDIHDKYKLDIYDLLLPILREELQKEQVVVQFSRDHQLSLLSSEDPAVQAEARAGARAALRAAGFGTAGESEEESEGENEGENNAASTEKTNAFKIEGEDFTSVAEFWDSRQVNRYILRNGTRGKALIINIVNFQETFENLKKRCGAEQDEETMKKLFDELGFVCDVHRDVKKSNLEGILGMYNSMDHSDCDAFICCIMTHGRLGKIYTADSQPYRILDVVDMFSSTKCPSLRGKPKVFFVQSCQRGSDSESTESSMGQLATERAALDKDSIPEPRRAHLVRDAMPDQDDEPGSGTTSSTQENSSVNHQSSAGAPSGQAAQYYGGASGGSSAGSSRQNSWEILNADEKAVLVPGEPDILMSYSALPGSISYRDISRGSLYISALAENLRKPMEIDRALKRVTADVEERVKEHEREHQTTYRRQLPFHLTTGMSKLLYLTPVKRV